jgi:hypothetical protein
MGARRRNEIREDPLQPRPKPRRERLAEAVMGIRSEAFWDAWVSAEADVMTAAEDWRSAARHERADAWAVYRAALDREQAAADALALLGAA